jgi:hypothetical protein
MVVILAVIAPEFGVRIACSAREALGDVSEVDRHHLASRPGIGQEQGGGIAEEGAELENPPGPDNSDQSRETGRLEKTDASNTAGREMDREGDGRGVEGLGLQEEDLWLDVGDPRTTVLVT